MVKNVLAPKLNRMRQHCIVGWNEGVRTQLRGVSQMSDVRAAEVVKRRRRCKIIVAGIARKERKRRRMIIIIMCQRRHPKRCWM